MVKAKLAAVLCAAATACLAACGPGSAPASGSGPSSPRSASAAPNGWTVSATAASNLTVTVAVTVEGPLTVRGGCEPPLSGYLTRQDGSAVPTSKPGIRCLAITVIQIPAGTSHTFTASMPAPSRGDYLVHARLNLISGTASPDLQVWVTV